MRPKYNPGRNQTALHHRVAIFEYTFFKFKLFEIFSKIIKKVISPKIRI